MKINYIKYAALSAAILGLAGCTDKVEYDAASMQTNAQVYFASTSQSAFDLAEDQNAVSVTVTRENTKGALTVGLASYAYYVEGKDAVETDIFNVPSSVTFADGAATAEIEVTFDFNDIRPETDYTVTIDLEGNDLNLYGKTQQEVSIMYAPWSEWEKIGTGFYTNSTPFGDSWEQDVLMRNSMLTPTKVQYSLPDLIVNGVDIVVDVDLATNLVTVPRQNTGYKNGDFYIEFCDALTFYRDVLHKDQDVWEPYVDASTFDPETGVISICTEFFSEKEPGKFSGWWDNYDYLQLPGYPHFEIEFSFEGTYVGKDYSEYSIIRTYPGTDVVSYAIDYAQGYLSDTQIDAVAQALIDDPEATLYPGAEDFQFPSQDDGYYTVVAVSYDKAGNPQKTSSFTYYYERQTTDWNYGWHTVTTDAAFYDVFFAGVWWNKPYGWYVELQESDRTPGLYRLVNPYASNPYGEEFNMGHYYLTIDATDPDNVVVEPSLTAYGYYVLSAQPGKLVDGNKIVFPAASLGIFTGYNEDGTMKLVIGWEEEAVLVDWSPEEENPEPEARPAAKKPMSKAPLKKAVRLYDGPKMKKEPTTIG